MDNRALISRNVQLNVRLPGGCRPLETAGLLEQHLLHLVVFQADDDILVIIKRAIGIKRQLDLVRLEFGGLLELAILVEYFVLQALGGGQPKAWVEPQHALE